ncbi:sema domain, transmembrane domain (TM), and cytoplasmic domain, (semaphorin) 6D, like isoform X4 [Leucoraja erinacea]|uniref:sema domain, transmembrane domain (TM), and cytoplasmic domain, (semaphorin) 6D, like isoform X4 n=1 Tax=Leucoraja erinaceus TaxID=7782 RepID=UPI0024582012|nr:sema domain, transmembrane domain (TM), and cytoplasmic domain, (semaphorin) 6D, like isoform X4 [Leucoraja erinacea]
MHGVETDHITPFAVDQFVFLLGVSVIWRSQELERIVCQARTQLVSPHGERVTEVVSILRRNSLVTSVKMSVNDCCFVVAAFLLTLHPAAAVSFPEDDKPINTIEFHFSRQHPLFRGRLLANESVHRLDYQLMLKIENMLYIAGRDQVYVINLNDPPRSEITSNQKLTWKSRQQDRSNCAMKGKHKEECHNFIKVFVPKTDETVFVCGTNAFNPVCRYYRLDTLDHNGEEVSGLARCPFDAKQTNVALFADNKLYSATVADFLASDAVIYRSMGDGSALRTIKYDSKWIKEPHFLHAVEYGNYVYFFFREIAVEHNNLGKAVYSRVARICKNDVGGSQRVLEKHWTSFLKARLNCSVPGDSFFYFDVLQSVTDIIQINGYPTVIGVFTTQLNSIPGSAVCAFNMDDIEKSFKGRFKEQKTPDSVWTAVPEDRIPKPRPGCCAGHSPAESYKTSIDFPDETLSFIKSHPLMDSAVPSLIEEPWFTKTRVRYRLTAVAIDNTAGPHQNYTIIFIGSEAGILLKVLTKTSTSSLNDSLLLEEMDVFNPLKCSSTNEDDRKVLGLQLDKDHHALFVAFSSCVIRVPLSHCEHHGTCKKACIGSRDPYCAWLDNKSCGVVKPGVHTGFEQDVESGRTAHLGECHGVRWDVQAGDANQMVHMNVLITCVLAAFVLGAFISGLAVYCHRDTYLRKARKMNKDAESAQSCTDSSGSFTKFNGLFDSPVKEYPHSIDTPKLYTNLLSNGKELPPSGDPKTMIVDSHGQPPELAALPTPESTPVLHQKGIQPIKNQWEKAQNNINAARKESPLKSPQIIPSSPTPQSPINHNGQIPSAVVLPNATHAYNMSFSNSNAHKAERKVQNIEMSIPGHSGKKEQLRAVEARNTLNDLLKHLNEGGTNSKTILGDIPMTRQNLMLGPMSKIVEVPPKVPNREASLYSPSSTLPRHSPTKRVDVPSTSNIQLSSLERERDRGYPRNSSQRHSISVLPKNVISSLNGAMLSRHPSFNRGGYFPPAPPMRMDSVHGTPLVIQPTSLSRQSSYSSSGTLPRSGIKRTPSIKPDVPPKPSFGQPTSPVTSLQKYTY